MENISSFIILTLTLVINIITIIICNYVTIYLIIHVYQARELNSLLVINTYIPVLLASIAHAGLSIRAILSDTLVYISDDSTICRVWGYIYLYIIMWLFGSFSVQAYVRMLNIIHPNRTYLHSFMTVLIFMILTWSVTLILLLPTIFLNVIAFQMTEYRCAVDLSTWKGNVYMILSFYSIPITVTAGVYLRVVRFIKASSLRSQQSRRTSMMRDARVILHTVILVCILVILGLPSAILWIQGLITGYLHPFTYRIQAIFIAITMLILAIAVPWTNPQVKRLLPMMDRQNTIQVQRIQQQLAHGSIRQ